MKHDAENPKPAHFVGKHIREGIAIASYGPFAFLNPTTRRYAFDLKPKGQDHEREESEEEEERPEAGTPGLEETPIVTDNGTSYINELYSNTFMLDDAPAALSSFEHEAPAQLTSAVTLNE